MQETKTRVMENNMVMEIDTKLDMLGYKGAMYPNDQALPMPVELCWYQVVSRS